MSDNQKISINLIGLEAKDEHFLKMVFKLSATRPREYRIIEDKGSELNDFSASDIVIVDKDNQASVSQWQKFIRSSSGKHSESTIFITKVKSNDVQKNTIQYPLVALRILSILDNVDVPLKKEVIPVLSDNNVLKAEPKQNQNVTGLYNVLVVDDSRAVREHISEELNKYQCNIDFAVNAEEGYWLIQKNEYSLVFLDVILPGMNGHELCKDIKSNKLLRSTPIVMLTSKSSPFDRVKGRLSGCNDYLTKPVKARKLHQIIEKYLYDEKKLTTSFSV